MELDIPCGNFNRENGTTFLDFPLFLGIFQWDEPTKRVPFTAEPEIPGILTKWKAPLTIYLPSGISETFCQVVRTPGQFRHCWARQIRHKQRISLFDGHKSIYSKKQKCSLFARLCHILFHVARIQISHWPCRQRVILFCSFILCVYLSELAKQDNAFIAQ